MAGSRFFESVSERQEVHRNKKPEENHVADEAAGAEEYREPGEERGEKADRPAETSPEAAEEELPQEYKEPEGRRKEQADYRDLLKRPGEGDRPEKRIDCRNEACSRSRFFHFIPEVGALVIGECVHGPAGIDVETCIRVPVPVRGQKPGVHVDRRCLFPDSKPQLYKGRLILGEGLIVEPDFQKIRAERFIVVQIFLRKIPVKKQDVFLREDILLVVIGSCKLRDRNRQHLLILFGIRSGENLCHTGVDCKEQCDWEKEHGGDPQAERTAGP